MAQHDRRIRRTRRLLIEALIALIMEKGYSKLTVQDILDRADVGRSTFYAHFRDREALLLACFDNVRDELRTEIDAMTPGASLPDPARPAAAIFAHAQRRQPVYRALCGKQGGTIVIGHLHGLVRGLLYEHLQPPPRRRRLRHAGRGRRRVLYQRDHRPAVVVGGARVPVRTLAPDPDVPSTGDAWDARRSWSASLGDRLTGPRLASLGSCGRPPGQSCRRRWGARADGDRHCVVPAAIIGPEGATH